MTLEPSFHPLLLFPTLGVSPSHQGEEQDVHLYYKVFSSTRHGFLGAGVVSQPLSHVWAAVSDPTLWPLYHKPIQTARLHQRVTNSISLGEPRGQRQQSQRQCSQEAGYSARSGGVSGCGMMGCHRVEPGLSMYLLTSCIPAPPVYLVCNTTLCALKQPRDFCCVCVEAKEVPALLVVKMLWEELGLACCEKQSLWASGPLGEGGQVGPGWG